MKKSDTLLFCDRANGKPIGTFLTPIIIRVGVIETSVDVDVVRIFRHCKNDHRLGRNFYKGLFGDSINVMLAAVAFNFKRVLRFFLRFICWWIQWPKSAFGGGIAVSQNLACAYVRTF